MPVKRKPTWRTGKPPHIGWWQASTGKDVHTWRWWNGRTWSMPAQDTTLAILAGRIACQAVPPYVGALIKWTLYWPKNARVERVRPPKKTVDS